MVKRRLMARRKIIQCRSDEREVERGRGLVRCEMMLMLHDRPTEGREVTVVVVLLTVHRTAVDGS
jgi:hypothetical protein